MNLVGDMTYLERRDEIRELENNTQLLINGLRLIATYPSLEGKIARKLLETQVRQLSVGKRNETQ